MKPEDRKRLKQHIEMIVEQGLFLITANENYYVFRVIEKERIG